MAGVVTFALVFGASALAGSAAHADDSSAVTVTAASQDADYQSSPLPDLAVTVSQTEGLIAQAITISWTGGKASTVPSSQTGGENYLQIMQCWGSVTDSDGVTGPDRTTCQFGGFATPGATRDQYLESADDIAPQDLQYSHLGTSYLDPPYTGIPFRSVDGDTVASAVDGAVTTVNLNSNAYFTKYTTNEVSWAGSAADGTGSITFEVQTTLAAPGLGCGAAETAADGTVTGQGCWLVIVPRGTGTNTASALFWDQWKHRIAIPLGFQAVGEHCAVGAQERQLAGTELISDAVSSWQPALCGSADGDAYTLLTTTDSDALNAANTTADAPLALTTQPLDTDDGAADDLTYAPVALTGVTVTFAIDRFPSATADAAEQAKAREPLTDMKLTPRLLAKLLTSSYTDSLPTNASTSHLGSNPRNLLYDPDFLAINDPEWAQQAIVNPAVADIMVTQGQSGYAEAIWEYILADADARAFLAGEPDPWGMTVNPYASTDASLNPTESALELPRSDFPKVDPAEAYAGTEKVLNSVSWRPFLSDLASGAYLTLRGDGQTLGDWDPNSTPAKWTKNARSLVGTRKVIALTDTSAAARYETVTASLLNPAGEYVQATVDTMTAAAAAMTTSSEQSSVRSFDAGSSEAKAATSAYPLTMAVYAAANPALDSDDVRDSYASFIAYAVTDGQEPGDDEGQLPDGYAPLPQAWRDQALAAAAAIAAPVAAAATTTSTGSGDVAGTTTAPASSAAEPVAETASDPSATGSTAAPLSAGATPDDPDLGGLSAALPLSALAGLLAAGATPFVGRLRRPL